MPKDYVKENPRILFDDICKYISTNSSLTKAQVKECFNTYHKMMYDVLSSEYISSDITISLPKLGYFYFSKINGRKKGDKYKIPTYFGSKEMKTVTLDEDENDIYKLRFKVGGTLNDFIKYKNFE